MRTAALISGGKDSLYAAYKASKENELVCLIAIKSKNHSSYMFHVPNVDLAKVQAKAMQLPIIFKETKGEKEKELKDLRDALFLAKTKYNVEAVVSGALFSEYQRKRVDKICGELGLKSLAPLWHIDAEDYLKSLIKDGFEVIITAIAAEGLTKDFLGMKIDKDFLSKVKKLKINYAGEGGEYESLVLNCPLFKKKIEIKRYKIKLENSCTGQFFIEDSVLS